MQDVRDLVEEGARVVSIRGLRGGLDIQGSREGGGSHGDAPSRGAGHGQEEAREEQHGIHDATMRSRPCLLSGPVL